LAVYYPRPDFYQTDWPMVDGSSRADREFPLSRVLERVELASFIGL